LLSCYWEKSHPTCTVGQPLDFDLFCLPMTDQWLNIFLFFRGSNIRRWWTISSTFFFMEECKERIAHCVSDERLTSHIHMWNSLPFMGEIVNSLFVAITKFSSYQFHLTLPLSWRQYVPQTIDSIQERVPWFSNNVLSLYLSLSLSLFFCRK
jgi:hypothetical protein